MEEDRKKFYAIARVENLELPDYISKTSLHSHVSSAVDEAMDNVKVYLKNKGINGKFNTHIDVFAREESVVRLIESIKAKIRA